MQLHHSPNSPFVRKVVIAAEVLGLTDRIELLPARGNLMARDPQFRAVNPSGQIPVLVADDIGEIFDSPVICDYLEDLAGGHRLSGTGRQRWLNLRDQAVGDSMLDAALQCRYEIALRPEALRWADWLNAWRNKIEDSCEALEAQADALAGRLDLGVISIFCALAYIDSRLSDVIGLRAAYPKTMAWFDDFALFPQVAPSDPSNFS